MLWWHVLHGAALLVRRVAWRLSSSDFGMSLWLMRSPRTVPSHSLNPYKDKPIWKPSVWPNLELYPEPPVTQAVALPLSHHVESENESEYSRPKLRIIVQIAYVLALSLTLVQLSILSGLLGTSNVIRCIRKLNTA